MLKGCQHLGAKGDEVSRKGMPLLGLSPTTHLDPELLPAARSIVSTSAVQMGDGQKWDFCDKMHCNCEITDG